jgi:hypothetical protein
MFGWYFKVYIFAITMAQISDKELKVMAQKLKGEYSNWAALLAEKISASDEWQERTKNPCTESNVRQIACGNISSGAHRRLFLLYGAELFGVAEKRNTKAKKAASTG